MRFSKKIKMILASFLILFPLFCFAQIDTGVTDKINSQTGAFLQTSGYEQTDEQGVAKVISLIIKGFLAVLGIIFIILVILAGYNWMTAAGEEEKVEKAQNTLRRAIIGLIIIVSAYAITYFVFSRF